MTLTFDAERHQDYVDDKPVPSVTQIVAPLGTGYDAPDEDLLELTYEAAAERGTVLHAYIQHRLPGGEPEDFELPAMYAGFADAVELFLAEHEIVPFAVEMPLGSVQLAGTPDLTCEFDGKNSILDWKFVASIEKSKVAAQLGGYRWLCELNGYTPDALYAVQFSKDGTYRLYPVDEEFARAAFSACWEAWTLKTHKHPRGKIGGVI